MKGTLRHYEELKKENPVKSRQLAAYDSAAKKSFKLPQIAQARQKSLSNKPGIVLDCNQPGAKLQLYDTLRDKYLKGFFINSTVQEAMRKTGILDAAGNVLDFHSKPLKSIPLREIIEERATQRYETNYSLKRASSTDSISHQRSQSNLRNSVGGASSNQTYRPSKVILKSISNGELQQIIQQQKEKIIKEMHEEIKSDHSRPNSDKDKVYSEKKLEESVPKNEENRKLLDESRLILGSIGKENENSVHENEKSVEKEGNDQSNQRSKDEQEDSENNEKRENLVAQEENPEDLENGALDQESNGDSEGRNKINNPDPGFFVTQDQSS